VPLKERSDLGRLGIERFAQPLDVESQSRKLRLQGVEVWCEYILHRLATHGLLADEVACLERPPGIVDDLQGRTEPLGQRSDRLLGEDLLRLDVLGGALPKAAVRKSGGTARERIGPPIAKTRKACETQRHILARPPERAEGYERRC
jgi:hypothetical protein